MFDLIKTNITRLKETQIFQSLTMALNTLFSFEVVGFQVSLCLLKSSMML